MALDAGAEWAHVLGLGVGHRPNRRRSRSLRSSTSARSIVSSLASVCGATPPAPNGPDFRRRGFRERGSLPRGLAGSRTARSRSLRSECSASSYACRSWQGPDLASGSLFVGEYLGGHVVGVYRCDVRYRKLALGG